LRDADDRKIPKVLYSGPAKYSYPRKKPGPEKLMDYKEVGPPERKPNRVKIGIALDENRFPPESLVQNFRKYDEEGNYKRKYQPSSKTAPGASSGGGAYAIMKAMSLSNPSRSAGRAPKARKR
jgi:hypothetical protein